MEILERMKKVFFCFLIFCLVVNIISCGQTTEENVNYAVSKANDTVTDTASSIDNSLFGEDSDTDVFKIFPEEGASVWEFVRTKSGYALVGSKNRRPWFQIVDKYGNNQLSKKFDVFGNYKSNFGNGLPAVGSLDGSTISQTNDGGYIVGTFVNPKHPSYGYSFIFKTNANGEIEWKRQLKYKSGSAKVVHFVEDIMQTSDGHFVAIGYTSGDSGNQIKGQGFMTKINKNDGTEKWMKRFGSNACVFDTLKSVIEDNENNLIAIGKYEKPCPGYVCHHGYACGDVYFLKIDPDSGGTLISKRHAPNRWWASGNSIIQLDDGNFIVGGRIKADNRKATNSAIWRLDKNGELVWSEPWTGTGRKENNDFHLEEVFALALSPNRDAIIAAGYTRLAGVRKAQKGDMMAWSMDLNGSQKWIKRYEVPGWQSAGDITQIKNNSFLLSGGRWFFEIDSDGNLLKINNENQ